MNFKRVHSGVRSAVAMVSLVIVAGCKQGGADVPASMASFRISEHVFVQGAESRPLRGATIEATNIAIGSMLAGQAAASSFQLSASFLTDPAK